MNQGLDGEDRKEMENRAGIAGRSMQTAFMVGLMLSVVSTIMLGITKWF